MLILRTLQPSRLAILSGLAVATVVSSSSLFEEQRRQLIAAIRANTDQVAAQIGKAALDKRVLSAMAKVPRHEFVPIEVQPYAYLNMPLPIGFDKTISQPLMVAVMTDLLELKPDDVVLEIGTGLGYQAAVLAELAGRVYSVEIIDELAQRAVQRLKRQGYTNIEVHVGNGYSGWPEHAPFDKLIVTAAPDLIPLPLINQLKARCETDLKLATDCGRHSAGRTQLERRNLS
jgi:protein-L-isoaspartate(D-aspartate) O-methyltransferase